MVSLAKLGSWFLLLIISYTLVSLVNAPRKGTGTWNADRGFRRRDPVHGVHRHPQLGRA